MEEKYIKKLEFNKILEELAKYSELIQEKNK